MVQVSRPCEDQLDILLRMCEMRLPYMKGRHTRIAKACAVLGQQLGLESREQGELMLAAKYHDIGMLSVPDRLLMKGEPLADDEIALVRRHVEFSGKLLAAAFPNCTEAQENTWYHHERPDGKGWFGLNETQIPVAANAIALAEAVESMANRRPHREPMGLEAIVAEVKRNAGTQFLSNVVAAFEQRAQAVYELVVAPAESEAEGRAEAAPNVA